MSDLSLALDTRTMQLSVIRMPWPWPACTAGRVGEETRDGPARLICARLLTDMIGVFALDKSKVPDSHGHWSLERCVTLQEDFVHRIYPQKPSHSMFSDFWPLACHLSNVDPSCTSKVFIRTFSNRQYSYDLDTGEFKPMITHDGLNFGQPVLPYYSADK